MRIFFFVVALMISTCAASKVQEKSNLANTKDEQKKSKVTHPTNTKKKMLFPPPSKVTLGFYQASQIKNYQMMDMYLSQGADINCRNCNSSGRTALSMAIAQTADVDVPLVKYLIQNGADTNFPEDKGVSPLMLAAQRAKFDYAKVGATALTIDLLLQNGAKLESVDDEGASAINYLSGWNAEKESIKRLVRAGVNINHQSKKTGMNLLMTAAQNCINSSPEIIDYLLQNNANRSLKEISGNTALDFAISSALQNQYCNPLVTILSK